jgi:hypothetical protein
MPSTFREHHPLLTGLNDLNNDNAFDFSFKNRVFNLNVGNLMVLAEGGV